jgi:nucleotide-binding universal stress UspA family protein
VSAQNQPLQFSLALDLRQRSDGALAFAQWLVRAVESAGQRKANVGAMHVIEPQQVAHLRDVRTFDDLVYFAKRGVQETAERMGAQQLLADCEVLSGNDVADALAQAATKANADALVIGRVAPRDAELLNRLGAIARKVLRQLPTTTIVVPPDLSANEVGGGPVVVALDASDNSLGAVHFARKISTALGRALVGVHVVGIPESWGYGYVSGEAAEAAMQSVRVAGERAIEDWAAKHAQTDLRLILAQGVASREIVRVAQDLDACLIVTGSRKLSTLERFFMTSVGTEVAASAEIPVAVVPNE